MGVELSHGAKQGTESPIPVSHEDEEGKAVKQRHADVRDSQVHNETIVGIFHSSFS